MAAVSRATNSETLTKQIETVKKERDSLVAQQQKLQVELDKIMREGQSLGTAVKSLDLTRSKLLADI